MFIPCIYVLRDKLRSVNDGMYENYGFIMDFIPVDLIFCNIFILDGINLLCCIITLFQIHLANITTYSIKWSLYNQSLVKKRERIFYLALIL